MTFSTRPRDFLAVGKAAARHASDKKAADIALFDVRRFSSVADAYMLATAESTPQLQALQNHLDRKIKDEFRLDPLRRDGIGSSSWAVLDYGGLVIHVMSPAARQFYALERLWENARHVDWERAQAPWAGRPMGEPRQLAGRPSGRASPEAGRHRARTLRKPPARRRAVRTARA